MEAPTRSRISRRDAVLDGLVDLFLAEGFSSFSVEDLAARLRCSKSTLYDIAPSKEQLITAVVRTFFRTATERVEAETVTRTDPVEQIGAYLGAISRELAPASAVFYADLQSFAPAREIYSQNTAIAAGRVRRLVQAAAPATSAQSAAFVGAVCAQTMASIQRGELEAMTGVDDATAYRLLADLVVRGVTAAPHPKAP